MNVAYLNQRAEYPKMPVHFASQETVEKGLTAEEPFNCFSILLEPCPFLIFSC